MVGDGLGTASSGCMAVATAEQAECYREDTHDAGRQDDVETEAEFHVEFGDVDRRVGLVEFGQLSCDQETQAVDRHTGAYCVQHQY